MILNGEKLTGLLMTIIRFVLPLQDHTIKKLLLVFWEIVPKTTPDGKLLQEMILVCDAYRKVSMFCLYFILTDFKMCELFIIFPVVFPRTCSIPMSSSVAPRCVSCASWRSLSCWSLWCLPFVLALSTVTATCAVMQSWPSTLSTGKHQSCVSLLTFWSNRLHRGGFTF